jgi:hypothetical protein
MWNRELERVTANETIPSDGSLAKIGLPRNGTPEVRATDYERAHGIQWHVYWSARTLNVAAAEAAAHRDLQAQRFALTPDARVVPPPGEQPELRIDDVLLVELED